MDRQLKQTAFFGTERRPRPLERHYKAPGAQAPLPDIARRVVVGRGSKPAADTPEVISGRPVFLVDQAAARALPAGVAGIDQHHSNAFQRRFVADQFPQLGKAPIRHPCPLVPLDLDPISDATKVFEGNQGPAAFGIGNDGFAQNMVRVALETRLLSGSAPERTLGGAGIDLLQGPAAGVLATTYIINLCAGVGLSGVVHSKVDDAHIHAQRIVCADQGGFRRIACRREYPFPANEHQINLPSGASEQVTLAITAGKRDALAPGEGPDRDGILAREEPKNAFVVRLSRKATKSATCLFVSGFQAVGDLRDAAHGGLGRQPKTGSHISVGQLVQIILPPDARSRRQSRQPVARRIASFQRGAQQFGLLRKGHQPNGCYKLHGSDAFLRFDVTLNNAFGDSANRTGVVAAAPKRRKARTQPGKFLTQNAARSALDPVHDFGDAQGRVGFNKQMHVVRHHFQRVNRHLVLDGDFRNQFLEPGINRSDQNFPPILRAPNEVVFQAENRPCIGSVSWLCAHVKRYTAVVHLTQEHRACARSAIPLPAKAGSFSRRTL